MTKLAELKKKQDALKAEMLEESNRAFSEITKEIFAKYPKLDSFAWRQYTPYFNDGDECVFGANTDSLDFVWDGEEIDDSYGEPENKELTGPWMAITELFKDMDEPMLKEMFGDHCKVIAKRDGVTVESYEHD